MASVATAVTVAKFAAVRQRENGWVRALSSLTYILYFIWIYALYIYLWIYVLVEFYHFFIYYDYRDYIIFFSLCLFSVRVTVRGLCGSVSKLVPS